IIVGMNVSPDLNVPKGSVARIVQIDLFGTKAVDIELSNQKAFLHSGDTLNSAMEADVIDEVKSRATSLLISLDTVVTSVRNTFNPQTEDNLRKSFASIQSALNNLDKSIVNNTSRLDKIFANIESITNNLEQNKDQITAILSNLNAVSDTLRRSQFAETIQQAREALHQASEVMQKINEGQGSAGLLVNDQKLYNDLDSSAKSLDELLKDLKENPGRYVHVSVFGKKEK
ncbi:MAG: MlaD family protein, partial [Chitinophagales bacterium]